MDYTELALERFSHDIFAIETTGCKVECADLDYGLCSLEVNKSHLNIYGRVMGGAIYTLADLAFGVAATTRAGDPVTLSGTINFVAPATGPKLFAEARCVKAGRHVSFFQIDVRDNDGRLVATVTNSGFSKGSPPEQ